MRSNSLDSKLKAKEVELKRHEQEIADQDEVFFFLLFSIKMYQDDTLLIVKLSMVKPGINIEW